MPSGEGTLGGGEFDARGGRRAQAIPPYIRLKFDFDPWVAIAHAAFKLSRPSDRLINKAEAVHVAFLGPKAGRGRFIEGDQQCVVVCTFADDAVGFVISV